MAVRICTSSLLPNAIPNLIPAIPHALDKVCKTTTLEYFDKFEIQDSAGEKSIYASSTMTIPLKFSTNRVISDWSNKFPVGLFGLQIKIILVLASIVAST